MTLRSCTAREVMVLLVWSAADGGAYGHEWPPSCSGDLGPVRDRGVPGAEGAAPVVVDRDGVVGGRVERDAGGDLVDRGRSLSAAAAGSGPGGAGVSQVELGGSVELDDRPAVRDDVARPGGSDAVDGDPPPDAVGDRQAGREEHGAERDVVGARPRPRPGTGWSCRPACSCSPVVGVVMVPSISISYSDPTWASFASSSAAATSARGSSGWSSSCWSGSGSTGPAPCPRRSRTGTGAALTCWCRARWPRSPPPGWIPGCSG